MVGRSNRPFGCHSAGGQSFMKECVRLLVVLQRENRRLYTIACCCWPHDLCMHSAWSLELWRSLAGGYS